MTPEQEIQTILLELGFTKLEAEIYLYLLQHPSATGYKIANSIGRSFAITYRALETLQSKGAIWVEAGKKRMTRAVPVREFLDQRERRFGEQRERIMAAVEHLPSGASDTRIYEIATVDQVYERSCALLDHARERVLMELFPEPLHHLRGAVESTAGRGVDVTVRIYQEDSLEGVRVIQSPFGNRTMDEFQSQWMSIFIDGREFLMAQLINNNAGVQYAVWSANLILARAMYAYINSDLHHYAFRKKLYESKSLKQAQDAYVEMETAFPPGGDAGFRDLLQWFRGEKTTDEI